MEVNMLFDDVLTEISMNIRQMMEELWVTWSQLGVEDAIKTDNVFKLVQIEKNLHQDVLNETRDKLKAMEEKVVELKKETRELSQYLSVDIVILEQGDSLLVDYKRKLEEQIVGYREMVAQRRQKMDRLLEWQHDLSDKLGVTFQDLQDVPLPSEDDLDRLKDELKILQAERDKRAEIFLNIQVEVKDIMDKLRIKPQNKFEHTVASSLSVDFKVTDLNMDRLAKLQQDLQEQYEQTNNRVLELRERLAKLWDCLEEDHIYRENFLHAHPGCHPQTEAAIKEEIKRCEQIKKQKIQEVVANVRTKIKLMWDMIMYTTQQREEFVHYYHDIYTEDTLSLHELYLDKITKFYNDNKQIFNLIMTRKNLWLKMTELEARASEPGRYHNRGGQLLREEKERKSIANNLPKIESQIRELVTQYEARTQNIFTVDGKPVIKLMEEEWDTRKAERHNKLSARKQALTPNTRLLRSLAISPLGKRNRTAAGLPATAEKNRPPTKRQLITGSATKAVATSANNLSALKRSAITTIKRRLSGRLAARVVAEGKLAPEVRRKLDYGANCKTEIAKTVNSSILKHKRTSTSKRRSAGRRSIGGSHTSTSQATSNEEHCTRLYTEPPLMESTLLTTYTDFKDGINEKQICRSSLAVKQFEMPLIICDVADEKKLSSKIHPSTPKVGKENALINAVTTPKNNMLHTPSHMTRSKTGNNGFATPRAPFSPVQRHNTANNITVKTPTSIGKSKSHTQIVRNKKFPPLI